MRYATKGNVKYYHLKDYLEHLQQLYKERYNTDLSLKEIDLIFRARILKKSAKIEVDDDTGEEYFRVKDVIGGGRFLK